MLYRFFITLKVSMLTIINSRKARTRSADMSHHIKGQDRNQITLFPESLVDFVTKENYVRVVDGVWVNEK